MAKSVSSLELWCREEEEEVVDDSRSRLRTLRRASSAEDWMERPRILKMRAMRFRSDIVVGRMGVVGSKLYGYELVG